MKIYTKIILDKNDSLLQEEFYYYNGNIAAPWVSIMTIRAPKEIN